MLRKSLWSASATLALLAALASPLAAVGGTPGQLPVGPAIIHVSCDAFTNTPQVESSVDVAVGDTVSLSLCSDPSTGYEWTQPSPATRPSPRSASGYRHPLPRRCRAPRASSRRR
jgi:hypothetical protein